MNLDEALASHWQKTGKTVEELMRNGTLTFQALRDLAKKAECERDQEIAKVVWLNYEDAYSRVKPARINQTWVVNLPNVSMSVEHCCPKRFERGLTPLESTLESRFLG